MLRPYIFEVWRMLGVDFGHEIGVDTNFQQRN
jgi:hypothetical protein